MKSKYLLICTVFLYLNLSNVFAQTPNMFYGTIETEYATKLKKLAPNDINIISSLNGYSAVKLSDKAAEKLHHMVLTHGPGFIFEKSEAQAINTINNHQSRQQQQKTASYSISEDQLVNQGITLVNNTNIDAHIRELEAYGTRYHTTQKARQSVLDLKQKWETISNGRSDVSVKIVEHQSTSMPSVVMTIQGQELPNEYVIIGGHIDSVSPERDTNAPGADDNASGIATITEVARVLFEMNFQPKRTIEFMAYAAEEVGLRGSREIAEDYKNRNVNVISYVQFDMTNYKGSPKDVYISDDSFNSTTLNSFLANLMDHYNASGSHQFTYDYTRCNYGCSDHYSWAQQGYAAAFPFEASFNESNPYIHTIRDTSTRFPTANATHAAKFAKLGLEYLIEVAKSKGSVTVPSYCSSNGNNVSDEYIQNVTIGNINNNSSAQNGYQDFTAQNTELKQNTSHTISITPKWTGRSYQEGYAVWIDLNQDSDFEDAGELVWSKSISTESPVSGSFSIPSTAKLGKTRIRVSMQYNKIPSPCGAFNYGEVEDYSVTIAEGGGTDPDPDICAGVPQYNANQNYQSGDKVVYFNTLYERTSNGWKRIGTCGVNRVVNDTEPIPTLVSNNKVVLVSPNPLKGKVITVRIQNELWKYKEVTIYDANGKLLQNISMKADSQNIDVSNLSAGIYFISLSNTNSIYTQQLVKE
ncbi:Por secretion system C-terminal sorting domain-containing protein [Tenacibaculum sp. MAR_2009_124]|uniref:M20/M25/M40 family metallo-hydrolase n=1 Tax=Tenacibaculum sp. MAR_2009_124 TaxID=1250059 RepID=UPI0008976EA5|nr:M20/M25/M40 family metallo-hydrolase [Tenacibaculum sp. MAR_2009_124]SEC29538.1 Por secretion system C-terminal sorting domain-containing protein [Tenacibaculum sp. MAR_2009_124]